MSYFSLILLCRKTNHYVANIARATAFVFIALSFFVSTNSFAQLDCTAQARTDLEKLFCRIKNTQEGRMLPSFSDFQKNSPKVQAALLKSPARRLNLTVPTVKSTAKSAQRSSRPNSSAQSPSSNQNSTERNRSASRSRNSENSGSSSISSSPSQNTLNGCRLVGDTIRCPDGTYRLSLNVANRFLRSGALSENNKMSMPAFAGDTNDSGAVKNYLFDAYVLYIEKMLEIGLGASTMSFTKFYYTFYDLQEKNQNFSDRFEKMFGFLKKDKATMAIQSSYTDAKPNALSECAALNAQIIVCDQKEINWVYHKK